MSSSKGHGKATKIATKMATKRRQISSRTAERLRAMNKRPADVLREHLMTFRDDLMRDGQGEAARGLTRLLREFDFVTRRLQGRRA